MAEGRKNDTKTVTCQIDDLRLVAGNVICLVKRRVKNTSAGTVSVFENIANLALRNSFDATTPTKFQLLFDFDLRACGLDLFLDLLRLLFGHAFLDCFGSALDQRFRFCES